MGQGVRGRCPLIRLPLVINNTPPPAAAAAAGQLNDSYLGKGGEKGEEKEEEMSE